MQVTLLIVADPEVRTEITRPVFGRSVLRRNLDSARAVGITRVIALPGIRDEVEELPLGSVGETLPGPLIVLFEGTSIRSGLLAHIAASVQDPSWRHESRTLYDGEGRPALFVGWDRNCLPGRMPIAPSQDLPPEWDDASAPGQEQWLDSGRDRGDPLVRVVQRSDRSRLEAQLLREVGLRPQRLWHQWVTAPLLRAMSWGKVTLAQWELVALAVSVGGAALITLDTWWSLFLGAVTVLLGVELTILLPCWVKLVGTGPQGRARTEGLLGHGVGVARAVRPLAHAALVLALGYAWVIEGAQRLRLLNLSVVELTVLIVSAACALILLAYARAQLRGGGWGHQFALARFDRFLGRVGVAAPWGRNEFALLELILALSALGGQPIVLWWVLLVASASRLWRWALMPVRAEAVPPSPQPVPPKVR